MMQVGFAKSIRQSFAVMGLLCLCMPAQAQKITPSQVFQMTQDIILQLNRMHDANFNQPDLSGLRLDIPNRLPRHVIQQALNVRLKIATLRQINGLPPTNIETPEVREVVPADVLQVVTVLLDDLKDFDAGFGLDPFVRSAPLEEGKTPSDVYRNLIRIQALVEQLGIPPTVPNDVFNVAKSISAELKSIQLAVGNHDMRMPVFDSMMKRPADAYQVAYQVLSLLKELSERDGYQIPKGVIMPDRLQSGITPRDVQQILLYCLAEISSLKVATGVTQRLELPEAAGGQTPSSVFDQINAAIDQINALMKQGA